MSEIKSMYQYILSTLTRITAESEWDTKTATEASGFLHYMQSQQFVVAFVIAEYLLGFTLQLSINLQGE